VYVLGVRPDQGQVRGVHIPGHRSAQSVVLTCRRRAGAVLLLGKHAVEGGLQVGPDRRYGVLLVQEREGVFQPAAVVRQLVGCKCVQWMLRLFDDGWLEGHECWS
jgi:hypothetical protein